MDFLAIINFPPNVDWKPVLGLIEHAVFPSKYVCSQVWLQNAEKKVIKTRDITEAYAIILLLSK